MRQLDEKRVGLLIRMKFHRVCVTSRKIIGPLHTRGLVYSVRPRTYALTTEGKNAAKEMIKRYTGKHIATYGGVSIGNEVLIVKELRGGEE